MIFRIFANDIGSIVKHFFVFVIIIAMCVIPSLYAWINIYADDDPYANTGNMPVAVASMDEGIELEKGKYVNAAGDVIDQLKNNDSIGWKFVGSPDEAVEGVEAGKYYAAVVFEDDFTYDMYHFDESILRDNSTITFYSNKKKNTVGAIIMDAAADSLLETINKTYLETVFSRIFKGVGDLGDKFSSDKAVDKVLNRLSGLSDDLRSYDEAIDSFAANSSGLKQILSDTKKKLADRKLKDKTALANTDVMLDEARDSVRAISESLKDKASSLKKSIGTLEDTINEIKPNMDKQKRDRLISKAEKASAKVLSALQKLRSLIPDDARLSGVRMLADTLDIMIIRAEGIHTALKDGPSKIKDAKDALSELKTLRKEDLVPNISLMISGLDSSLDMVEPLISSAGSTLDNINPVLDAAEGTVDSIDNTLAPLQKVLEASADKVDEIVDKVRNADKDQRAGMLIKMMGADPDRYSRFFTSLVNVNVQHIYPVKGYGEAMSPFFSALALWVGGVMLVSLLRTKVNRKKFPQATEAQCFFGRFLTFFVIGQIQAAILIAGNIYLLGCAPAHPGLWFLAAGITSLVFTMLIYGLTHAFGDVGKAIVIVIMVLQISGSSGSYPIEILPGIYEKIYSLFPFPYAINAMREALYGTYGSDIVIYLAQLMVLLVIGVIIGLFMRRPFAGMNRFMNEKLEETEVL